MIYQDKYGWIRRENLYKYTLIRGLCLYIDPKKVLSDYNGIRVHRPCDQANVGGT